MASIISREDFQRIRMSLAMAVGMAAIGAALAFGASRILHFEKMSNRQAEIANKDIRGKLARAREEEIEIKQKLALYNELAGRGIIGEELRLDWVERIRQVGEARKLAGFEYELSPQRLLDPAVLPGNSGDFDFLASSMKLKLRLLHEEDLLNFLADLRSSVSAYLRVQDCSVERLPKTDSPRGRIAPQLKAECTIDWITLRERKRG